MNLGRALFDGLLLSILICGWISVILKVNPRYEMKSFPPEIVKTVTPQTKKERKGFAMMALPVMCIALGYLAFSINSVYLNTHFITLFFHAFISMMIWNLIDLFVFDWLIFCKINPDFMTLPGTKGNPAYQDYQYHFIGFLKGVILCLVGAVLLAGLIFVLKRL